MNNELITVGGGGYAAQHGHHGQHSLRRGDLISSKSVDYSAMADSSDMFNRFGNGNANPALSGLASGGHEESLRSRRHRSRSVEKLTDSSRRIDMDSGTL